MSFKDDLTDSLAKHTVFYTGGENAVRDLAEKVHEDVARGLYTQIVRETEEMVMGLMNIARQIMVTNGGSEQMLEELDGLKQSMHQTFTEEI